MADFNGTSHPGEAQETNVGPRKAAEPGLPWVREAGSPGSDGGSTFGGSSDSGAGRNWSGVEDIFFSLSSSPFDSQKIFLLLIMDLEPHRDLLFYLSGKEDSTICSLFLYIHRKKIKLLNEREVFLPVPQNLSMS